VVAVFSPLSQEFILHDLQLSKLIIIGDGDDNWLNYTTFRCWEKRGSRGARASLAAACAAWRSKKGRPGGREEGARFASSFYLRGERGLRETLWAFELS
jgi:hypothetical protein